MPKDPKEELLKLAGVGPMTADRLVDAGYDILRIATATPEDLAEAMEGGTAVASKVIESAKASANIGGYSRAEEVLERRKEIVNLSTGSTNLDALLGHGVQTQAITEAAAEFGCGKTQLALTLAAICTQPEDAGGLDAEVVFIDTENTFRPERLAQISLARKLEPKGVLHRVHVAPAYNSAHQVLLVEKAEALAREARVGLIIVDSLMARFRAEYIGRQTLAPRQAKLNQHLHDLLDFGQRHNAAVYVTNQVAARPDAFFGDPNRPIGGNIVGHASTYRLYLRRAKGGKRVARLIDSPDMPEGECVFKLDETGIADA